MSDTTDRFCPTCGSRIKKQDANFCSTCGSPLAVQNTGQNTQSTQDTAQSTDTAQESTSPYQASQQPVPYSQAPQTSQADTRTSRFSDPYAYGEQQKQIQTKGALVTPNDIPPVSGTFFTRSEWAGIGFFSAAGWLAHLMRYFLLFNVFPSFTELIVPVVMYPVSIVLIFSAQKYLMRSNGIHPDIDANRFDYTMSVVFSSFFLSFVPTRLSINKELTTAPEVLNVPTSNQYGFNYQEMSRQQYIGTSIRPRMFMFSSFFVLILSFVSIWMYFSVTDPSYYRSWQLLTIFLSGYVVVELAPIFGRHNRESSDYGRFRTLGIFILGAVVWVSALLGERFFTALLNRAPI